MFPERTYCVRGLFKAKEQNFRTNKFDSGKLKRTYLNRPRSTLAVKVLIIYPRVKYCAFRLINLIWSTVILVLSSCLFVQP
jgi:hypothetical protein